MLSRVVSQITGLDNDRKAVERAGRRWRDYENVEFILHDVESFEQSPMARPADYVISVFALHHTELDAAINTLKHIAGPHGKILIIDLFADSLKSVRAYLCDQLITSQLRCRSVVRETIACYGLSSVMRFLLWRMRFSIRRGGLQHIREDLKMGLPPPLQWWSDKLTAALPLGTLRPVLGSVFTYSWTPTGNPDSRGRSESQEV